MINVGVGLILLSYETSEVNFLRDCFDVAPNVHINETESSSQQQNLLFCSVSQRKSVI